LRIERGAQRQRGDAALTADFRYLRKIGSVQRRGPAPSHERGDREKKR
jgi:hypothetical protein